MKLKNIIYTSIAATALIGTHYISTDIVYQDNKIYKYEESFIETATTGEAIGLTAGFLAIGFGFYVAYLGYKNNEEWEKIKSDKP